MAVSVHEKASVQSTVASTTDDSSIHSQVVVDDAWAYLDNHRDASHEDIDLVALRRKIDKRILPLLLIAYTLQFLDKVVYNYAGVMTLRQDLNLQGNDFSNVATFLFVGQAVYEIPNVYLIHKFPTAKYLAFNLLLCGLVTACGAATYNYPTLVVARTFLGCLEGAIPPSIALIICQWYTRAEQPSRFAFYYLGLGLGQILGGCISFGFQHVSVNGSDVLAPWRIMFLTTGLGTVVIGICVYYLLADNPMTARWLTHAERVAVLRHVSVNQTGIESREFRGKEIWEALCDPKIWLFTSSVLLTALSGGVISAYSATLIKNLGFTDPKLAALINMPSGAVSMLATLVVAYGIRRQSHRWAWIIACIVPSMVGAALMSFLPTANRAGILAGIYLVNTSFANLPLFVNWNMVNTGGTTKRAFVVSGLCSVFAIGNLISPQMFQARDAPEYRPAKIAVMATQAGAIVTVFCTFLYLVWQNKKRRTSQLGEGDVSMDRQTWVRMTDLENKAFRYSY